MPASFQQMYLPNWFVKLYFSITLKKVKDLAQQNNLPYREEKGSEEDVKERLPRQWKQKERSSERRTKLVLLKKPTDLCLRENTEKPTRTQFSKHKTHIHHNILLISEKYCNHQMATINIYLP